MAKELDVTKMSSLQSSLSRASKLMQLESSGALDKIAKGVRDDIGSELLGEGSMDAASLMTTNVPKRGSMPIQQREVSSSASKNIPSAILESFKSNPIDDTALYNGIASDSGSLDFLTEGLQTPQQQPQRQQVRESVSRIVSEGLGQQTNTVQQGIDYPMIRTIVEDIVRKYAQSLNKRIISENKQSVNEVNTIALGKTFKFLSNDGTIYECTMKKVGNINDKKRSTI